MLGQEASVFPKQIKLDDYGEFSEENVVRILETSNMLVGSGARTSNAAIVLAKALHFMNEEAAFQLEGMTFLDLGCGTGLLGIYLACLGARALLADVPSVRDLAERNISLNRALIGGRAEFASVNWKRQGCVGKCEQMSGQSSTSSEREECLLHLVQRADYTVVCECGGLSDFQHHLRWMGKKGLIVCFLERDFMSPLDYMEARALQQFLLKAEYNYQRMEGYHPDYHDERVQIYRIWR